MTAKRKNVVVVKNTLKNMEENVMQRACANRRERQRTKELNDAFSTLRRLIPSMPSDKMSKIHTLRIATDYISFLDEMKQNGAKLFGRSILDEKNGYGIQAAFNLWRSNHGLTSSNIPNSPAIVPNQPSTSNTQPVPIITSTYPMSFCPKDYTELGFIPTSSSLSAANQLTPIHWN